ncbi:glycosyltransferase family 39 protein [Nostoc sp. CENA67]|uniref:Glycosyltransferase family 39 protein n=1 Tax=Amazonocrinis nigriterrae CENA67 TaxID=2794033 RepID=A0A8J7I1G1_9NOST|nr:glycosyltransferase family 39 protein [Amazonocrinis nigriterrae]MBH8566534.1 glycosyltransferase family 39 protein [Amazonocrinis nigriterrae CENA67]
MNKDLISPKFFGQFSLEWLLLSAIALGVLLRIINLGSREFWYDEVLSLLISTGKNSAYNSPKDTPVVLAEYTSLLSISVETGIRDFILTISSLLKSLLGGEPHPPLFFLSQHLWLLLFGNSEAAMRSLNTFLSIAAMGSAYGLGRVFLGHRGGLFLAALLGINPFYLFHSLNVRMYAPLVLWATLSAWALLHLIYQKDTQIPQNHRSQIVWNVLLIGSVAAGILTFYLYAYWLITLAVLVLYLDRNHWWQHGLRLGAGVLLTIPWVLWGTLKQLRNADLKRFSAVKEVSSAWLQHLQDVAQTLGINLLVGDWVSSLAPMSVAIAGCLVILLLLASSISLWKCGEKTNLTVALILGLLPLSLALGVDIVAQKFTVGFGWGRTMIIILPGCLLLLVLWVERGVPSQWRTSIVASLLFLYLTISIGDFSLRHRSVFHRVADLILQDTNQPTLIAMNSKAWGHVMRLAYYIPPQANVMLLADKPANLATSLEKVLKDEAEKYPRVLWLDSSDPLWSRLKTEAEINRENQRIQQILSNKFQLKNTQDVSGTMSLDKFTLKLYTRS